MRTVPEEGEEQYYVNGLKLKLRFDHDITFDLSRAVRKKKNFCEETA
jgi:hypothetical protein